MNANRIKQLEDLCINLRLAKTNPRMPLGEVFRASIVVVLVFARLCLLGDLLAGDRMSTVTTTTAKLVDVGSESSTISPTTHSVITSGGGVSPTTSSGATSPGGSATYAGSDGDLENQLATMLLLDGKKEIGNRTWHVEYEPNVDSLNFQHTNWHVSYHRPLQWGREFKGLLKLQSVTPCSYRRVASRPLGAEAK